MFYFRKLELDRRIPKLKQRKTDKVQEPANEFH